MQVMNVLSLLRCEMHVQSRNAEHESSIIDETTKKG